MRSRMPGVILRNVVKSFGETDVIHGVDIDRATSGVPTGLQIIGRPQDDPTVFKIARAFEKERPWLDSAERRPNLDY